MTPVVAAKPKVQFTEMQIARGVCFAFHSAMYDAYAIRLIESRKRNHKATVAYNAKRMLFHMQRMNVLAKEERNG